ncbi:MAG: hypothetical protein HY721_15190, partial [Planctomycetes bacterium]|nr:hypothetical protein [Planctomycetota bacterium]
VSFLAKVKPEVLGGVRARALAAIAAALVLGPREVQAHGVRLEAWREGKMVVVAAEFTDGTAVQGAEATVIPVGAEPGAPPLARGRTDSRGLFEFDPGLEATVVVVVADDAGHRVQRELEVGGGLPQGRPRRGFLEERGALLLPAAAGVLAIGLSALVLRLALRCFASRRRRAS